MIWHKTDDGLGEIVHGDKDVYEAEERQQQKLVPTEVAAPL